MTVAELIRKLLEVEDVTKEVYIFRDQDRTEVLDVDEMSDLVDLNIRPDFGCHSDHNEDISILTTSYVDLDDLIEEHGEAKAQVLFEQFRNTPPDGEPDKDFAKSIVNRLPKGAAVLTRVEWALENPDSDTALEWCQHYHFDFPIIKSKGMLEVGSSHYYAHVYGDDNGGETWKHQGDAIEYFTQMIKEMEIAA